MRNSKQMVSERLPKLWLAQEVQEDVVRELASHLEDCGEDGGNAEELLAAVNWAQFARNVRRGKETWMDRMKQIVVPGLFALMISAAAQSLSYFLGLRTFLFPTHSTAYVLQWPWLAALPIAGGVAAYAARRNGASPGRRIGAAMFPALLLTPLMVVSGVIQITYRVFAGTLAQFPFQALAGYLVSWSLVPAVPLLLGAAFFLGGRAEPRPSEQAQTA